jgi:hypothetical protein
MPRVCRPRRCGSRHCRAPFDSMSAVDSRSDTRRDWLLYQVLRQSWLQRQLFFKLLLRDFAERYRGSYLGVLWSFVLPLLSLRALAAIR